jgi:hypothetical protein
MRSSLHLEGGTGHLDSQEPNGGLFGFGHYPFISLELASAVSASSTPPIRWYTVFQKCRILPELKV